MIWRWRKENYLQLKRDLFLGYQGDCQRRTARPCCRGSVPGSVHSRQGCLRKGSQRTPRQWGPRGWRLHCVDAETHFLSKVAIVIHNAGTLGQDGRKITVSSHFHLVVWHTRLQDMTDMEEMQAYYRVNLFHVICLNSVFTSLFPKSRMAYINISR